MQAIVKMKIVRLSSCTSPKQFDERYQGESGVWDAERTKKELGRQKYHIKSAKRDQRSS